jgi:NAD(P)-dependent dehydrogenase (short-subunit alcohol dehydrogenase family)
MSGKARAVLVTGASTGIGRSIGRHLSSHDVRVFATARVRELCGDSIDQTRERVRRPRTRHLVGTDARIAATLAWLLPDRLLDRMDAAAVPLAHFSSRMRSNSASALGSWD